MSHRAWLLSVTITLLVVAAVPLSAQTAPPSGSLKGQFAAMANATQALTGGIIPPAVFENLGTLSELLTLEVSTGPAGTSTGGFTYTFDSQLQTWTRSAQSFGPAFAERSLTTGRSKFSAGFNWLHAAYSTIADQDMKNGELRMAKNGQIPVFPVSYTTMTADFSSDTIVAFGVAGVTDDLDVGLTIPWVRVSASAELASFRQDNSDLTAGRHPTVPQTSAAGVGDISIFAKYHAWHHQGGGLAGEIQMYLPTGDTNNFRGTGVTRTLLSAIWSQGGKVSPHANIGYELWSSEVSLAASRNVVAKNQFKYAFGLEFQANPRVTASVDLLGRRLLKGGQLGYITYGAIGFPGTADELEALPQALDVMSVVPGIKWNVWRKLLLTGNLLASLKNGGFRANAIPVIGLDWAF